MSAQHEHARLACKALTSHQPQKPQDRGRNDLFAPKRRGE
jgi:hypothetical protein